jgi:formate hydrogenlyase subunit 3/multisubunit Na+/H+ antiporter MnhD subunit
MVSVYVLLPILIPLTGAAISLLLRTNKRVQAGWTLGVMFTSFIASVWLLVTGYSNRHSTGIPGWGLGSSIRHHLYR